MQQQSTATNDNNDNYDNYNHLWIPYLPEDYSIDDVYEFIEKTQKIGQVKQINFIDSKHGVLSAKIVLNHWFENDYAKWIRMMILDNGIFKTNDGDKLFELMILNRPVSSFNDIVLELGVIIFVDGKE